MVSVCFPNRAAVFLQLFLLLLLNGVTSSATCSATLQSQLDDARDICIALFSTSDCGPTTCQCNAYTKQAACMTQNMTTPENAACDMSKINGTYGLQGVKESQVEWECAKVLTREAAATSCGDSYKITDCMGKITATRGTCEYFTQALECYDATECASNTNADFQQARTTTENYKKTMCPKRSTTEAPSDDITVSSPSDDITISSPSDDTTISSPRDDTTKAGAAASGSTKTAINLVAAAFTAVFALTSCI